MVVLFVVGPPGVGKTTFVRRLLNADSHFVVRPKWTVGTTVCAAGHYTGSVFDGADTVPYNGVKECIAYWEANLSGLALTIFDGDRFSNKGVVEFFVERPVQLCCVHLTAPDEELRARREKRGSRQNESWVKGRVTKAARFSEAFPAMVKGKLLGRHAFPDSLKKELDNVV